MTTTEHDSLFHNLKKQVLFQRPETNSQLPKSNTIICSCWWVLMGHRSKTVPRKASYIFLSTKKRWVPLKCAEKLYDGTFIFFYYYYYGFTSSCLHNHLNLNLTYSEMDGGNWAQRGWWFVCCPPESSIQLILLKEYRAICEAGEHLVSRFWHLF